VIAQEYSPETQSQLISGLAVLHNVIHTYNPNDVLNDPNLEMATILDEEMAQAECRTARLADWAVGNKE
jgi:hypothetical protein